MLSRAEIKVLDKQIKRLGNRLAFRPACAKAPGWRAEMAALEAKRLAGMTRLERAFQRWAA
jgi:hypothetical protein